MEDWKKFFAPADDVTLPIIKVSLDWVNFICSLLLTPDKFEWAKSFLQSPTWQIIQEGNICNEYQEFIIPAACPVNQPPLCAQEVSESSRSPVSPPVKEGDSSAPVEQQLKGRRKERPPVVESEVRSERLLHINKGFKKKTCQDANCMVCLAQPPAL